MPRPLAAVDFGWPVGAGGAAGHASAGVAPRWVSAATARGWTLLRAVDAARGRIYTPADDRAAAEASCMDAGLAEIAIDTLDVTLEIAGATAGATCTAHYVVETDVEPGAEDDFNAWYDTEHLPGLAAVPGVIRALRYRKASDRPRYGAAYDLAWRDAFGSAPWLAVRATPWSSRVRPSFRRTARTLYAVVAPPSR